MKRALLQMTLIVTFALLQNTVVAADNELTSEEKSEGWVLLFNGKNHEGWQCNNGKEIATPIEDECLVPYKSCLLYTSPSPRDSNLSRMPSSA